MFVILHGDDYGRWLTASWDEVEETESHDAGRVIRVGGSVKGMAFVLLGRSAS
jgi:hypothetical protein